MTVSTGYRASWLGVGGRSLLLWSRKYIRCLSVTAGQLCITQQKDNTIPRHLLITLIYLPTTMHSSWTPPPIGSRPLALLGAGVLGRRIACVFAAAGYNVNLYDPSLSAQQAALDYVTQNLKTYSKFSKGNRCFGHCRAFSDLESTVSDAWLVIEAVPEHLQMKIDVMGELDKLAPVDCILASNSSSFKSRSMLEKVGGHRRPLVCNMHFYMPPEKRVVELMTDGETWPDVFPFLTRVLEDVGMVPVTARRESTG